ncbi:MAG: DUF4390 domain-containing protein [Thermodesulfobacteriota bacterium]
MKQWIMTTCSFRPLLSIHSTRCTLLSVVFLLVSVLSADVSSAKEVGITNLIVTNTKNDLLLYLTVENSFPDTVIAAVEHGLPTTFSFYVVLYQSRSFWFDKKLVDETVTHTVQYNNLKKEYVVTRSWDTEKTRVVKTLEEAMNLMVDIDGLKVIPLKKLEKGRQYQLLTKVRLKKATLPFSLHYVLLFMTFWDVETDWYSVDFIF